MAARNPTRIMRILGIHDLGRDRAGERDGGGDRQVDIAGAEGDDEHLADADDDEEDGEGEGGGEDVARAHAAR